MDRGENAVRQAGDADRARNAERRLCDAPAERATRRCTGPRPAGRARSLRAATVKLSSLCASLRTAWVRAARTRAGPRSVLNRYSELKFKPKASGTLQVRPPRGSGLFHNGQSVIGRAHQIRRIFYWTWAGRSAQIPEIKNKPSWGSDKEVR